VMLGFGVLALAASIYLVLVLEILKFRRFRERDLRGRVETGDMPVLTREEIEAEIAREMETGEFEPVDPGR
jgi:UDP-GlcNAc:undecaprenyl-phosphate/decaprenyl-phosphate GlcNAc-1-phosphate transferase